MRTTLSIDDALYRDVKVSAALQGRTVGSIVEAALRAYLSQSNIPVELPPLSRSTGARLMPGIDLDDMSTVMDSLDKDRPFDARR